MQTVVVERALKRMLEGAGPVLGLAMFMSLCPTTVRGQPMQIDAPNVVVITPALVTSGQPSAAALGKLASQGFGAVINLAPPTVRGAVGDEPAIVERQGLRYTSIPIDFDNPTEADFDAFTAALSRAAGQKVLVHCQFNMRASSMVFLHRTIVGKEPPGHAYESVTRVWSPQGPWKRLITDLLRKHRIAFDAY